MTVFLALMLFASGLSLVRGLAIAYILAPESFGVYATLFAAGSFLANMLSLGRVEATWKEYPRLWLAGRPAAVLASADGLIRTLGIRAGCVALALAGPAWLIFGLEAVPHAAGCAAVAFGVAISSVYASAQRAAYNLMRLAGATLARAVSALLIACLGAWALSWPGAIAGEFLGAGLGAMASRALLSASVRESRTPEMPAGARADSDPKPNRGGVWLFAAFLVGAAPLYLDRVFVSAVFRSEEVGTYGILALFVVGAVTVLGIANQKLGPQFLLKEHSGSPWISIVGLALRWVTVFWVVVAIGMGAVWWFLTQGPLAELGARYLLNGSLFLVTSLLCGAQVTAIFEWVLIAADRERQVFYGSAAFFLAACFAAALTGMFNLSLLQFLTALLIAKLLHVGVQAVFVGRLAGGGHSM